MHCTLPCGRPPRAARAWGPPPHPCFGAGSLHHGALFGLVALQPLGPLHHPSTLAPVSAGPCEQHSLANTTLATDVWTGAPDAWSPATCCPGIWSQVKRAPKSSKKRKTYEVDGPARPGAMPMDERARQIFRYFKSYNYEVWPRPPAPWHARFSLRPKPRAPVGVQNARPCDVPTAALAASAPSVVIAPHAPSVLPVAWLG